ncbi:caspase domain-containing protein [Pannonibacter indicus]|uniref:caspase family protein n=1 Tax=Pannonibacter indicus TaxID=466044 RepID=UPI0035AFF837
MRQADSGSRKMMAEPARLVPAMMMAVLVLCLVLLGAVAPARAQDTASRLALVIGNAAYDSPALPALKNPANDAALISGSLKAAGFEVTLVMDADLRAMKAAVRDFTARLKAAPSDTLAAVYYSGHGFAAGGRNYLAPLGADLREEVDAEFEALPVDWVLAAVEEAHDGPNIIILDACRNTALTRSAGGSAGGLTLLTGTPRGSFISFATAPGSTAADGQGLNSPYSAAIARELLVPGASIETVFKRVRQDVVTATDGAQVPWDHSSLTTDIILMPTADSADAAGAGPAPAATAEALQQELVFWNGVKDSRTSSDYEAYLERFPAGAFAELARMRLASLPAADTGQIEQLFAALQSRSLLVENPQRPHEFYANARLRELKGDYPGARQDYLKYFAFGEPQIDPHLRFQAVLKVQEGRAGAREVYRALSAGRRDPATLFAAILLEERDERVRRLGSFIEAYPDFGPALYELSLDYSQSRLGQQSLADKTREKDLLTRFVEAADQGKVLRYFIDQQMATSWLEDARSRLAALSAMSDEAMANPLQLSATRSNQGWLMTLSIADKAREIFVRLPGGEFRSTGVMSGAMDPATGQPLPYPGFELPGSASAMEIEVQYTNLRGETQGPYTLHFDPDMALIAGQKDILERFWNSWISFGGGREQLAYFTHLISYRCALSGVRYGINKDEPDTAFDTGPCDPDNPHAVPRSGPGSDVYLQVPRSTAYITVQLTYRDGTRSDVRRFDAPR